MYQGPFYKRRLPKITFGRNYSNLQGFCRRQVILKHNRSILNQKHLLQLACIMSPSELQTSVFMGVKINITGYPKLLTGLRDIPDFNSHCKKTIQTLCFLQYLYFFSLYLYFSLYYSFYYRHVH